MEHNNHFFHGLFQKKITEIYIMMAIRSFAMAFITIFVPLILLNEGYSFVDIIFFYVWMMFFNLCANGISLWICAKLGVKKSIILSILPNILFYLAIYSFDTHHWNIVLLAFLAGISAGLFWYAFHIQFTKQLTKNCSGSQLGFMQSLELVAGIIGPAVGGIILTFFNTQVLMLSGCIILILSVIPIIHSQDREVTFPIPKKWHTFTIKKSHAVVFFSEGIVQYSLLLWPLFIFLLGVQLLALGILYSIVKVFTIGITLVVGKYSDLHQSRLLLKIGSASHSILCILRGILYIPVAITAVTIAGDVCYATMNLPYSKIWMSEAAKMGSFYIMFREVFLLAGRIFVLFLILGVYLYTGNILTACIVGFIIGAIASLCYNMLD